MALQKDAVNLQTGGLSGDIFVDNWEAGTFTATRSANLTKVKLISSKTGTPGIAELAIRDIDIGNNKPQTSPITDVNNPNVAAPTLAAANTSGGSGNRRFAFEFTPGITGFLKEVDIQLQKNGTTSGLSLIADIFLADGSGFPTGAVLATETLTDAQVASSAPTTIVFTTPASVVASTTYVIVLRDDDNVSTANFYESFGDSGSGRFATSDDLGSSFSTNVGDLYIVTRVSQVSSPDLGVATLGSVPTSKSVVEFDFSSSPIPIVSGNRYAMVLRTPTGSAGNQYNTERTINGAGSIPFEDRYRSTDGGKIWAVAGSENFSFITEFDDDQPSPALDQAIFGTDTSSLIIGSTVVGQTFTPSVSGDLKKIQVAVTKLGGNLTESVVFEVRTTSGGLPTTTVLASESVIRTFFPSDPAVQVREITFTTPAALTSGTKYAIVIIGDNAFEFYRVYRTNGNDYDVSAQGVFSGDGGASFSSGTDDFLLGTFMLVPTTQTINSDAVVVLETTQTIDSDAFVGEETTQTIDSDTNIASEITQQISSDAFVGEETTQVINSDTNIEGTVTQTILSDLTVAFEVEQTIDSDANVLGTTTQGIASNSTIQVETEQTIVSDANITRNEPELKLFASTAPTVEVGTPSNPLIFTGVIAGEEFQHPDNPFFLYNDKGGGLQSVDAKSINFRVIAFELVDEVVGTSDGNNDQTFTVAFPPVFEEDINYPLTVKVASIIYSRVDDISTAGPTDEVYEFDFTTGIVLFGDNITGKVPPLANIITVTYTPDTKDFGSEIASLDWFGVQSNGVVSNPVTIELERQTSNSTTTVIAAHAPNITAVTGVFLNNDPNRLGTNFFLPGGSFNAQTGEITLGTALPSATEQVLIDYQYEIEDDAEGDFTDIGQENSVTFENVIPSNNAKKLFFRLTPPDSTSPSGFMNLKFKIRIAFSG